MGWRGVGSRWVGKRSIALSIIQTPPGHPTAPPDTLPWWGSRPPARSAGSAGGGSAFSSLGF